VNVATPTARATWASGLGFVLAAAGSAIGLGNLWRFPYIVGENGGGLFVVVYLAAIVLVGLPILIVEIALGRASRRSVVGAFAVLDGRHSRWQALGWLGVAAASMALSCYAVVAGWAFHYLVLSTRGALAGVTADRVQGMFGALYTDGGLNLAWGLLFMAVTVGVVLGGVRGGIERWSRVLMPILFIILLVLLGRSATLDGFRPGFEFVFGLRADQLTPAGILEALGHAFFTLGVGVGAMLTYGSYLDRKANLVRDALAIAAIDTLVALVACVVIFPIAFTYGLGTAQGPGLVFVNLPVAFGQMPGGVVLAPLFFALLAFAALTSAISMLEVPVAYLIDERGWSRRRAVLTAGGLIALASVPAALSGGGGPFGEGLAQLAGKNWFDLVFDAVSNWMMPAGGLGFAVFGGWVLAEATRRAQFPSTFARFLYRGWLAVLRFGVPLAVITVFLHAIGLL
jgi:NSS family neurotransmitter:Na+ symporter